MLNDIAASLIGLAGGLLAALLAAWHQANNTKALIAAEFDKPERQNRSAVRSRKEPSRTRFAAQLNSGVRFSQPDIQGICNEATSSCGGKRSASFVMLYDYC